MSDLIQIKEVPIPILKGKYFASTCGRLFREVKPHENGNGYLKFTISIKGHRLKYLAHRLIAKTFIKSDITKHEQVNHKNKNTTDNSLANLEIMSNAQNQKHKLNGYDSQQMDITKSQLGEPF